MTVVRIPNQLLIKKGCVEYIDTHAHKGLCRVVRLRIRTMWLLLEINDSRLLVHLEYAKSLRILYGYIDASNGHICLAAYMISQHLPIIHFVDMVSGKNQHIFRHHLAKNVQILEDGICRPFVQFSFDTLLRWQQFDKLIELPAQKSPASLHMLNQTMRFILSDNSDSSNP